MFSFIFIESPWGTATVVNSCNTTNVAQIKPAGEMNTAKTPVVQCQSCSATVLKSLPPKSQVHIKVPPHEQGLFWDLRKLTANYT